MKSLIAGIIISFSFLQPFVLVSPISAETVNMQYTDPDHLHAPKEVTIDGIETDYQYDANGNLENDGERIISWNQDNLPTKIVKGDQEVEFFYDADGRRIVKKIGEDKTVYVNQYYQSSIINHQSSFIKYYFANGRIAQSKEDNLSFLHQDHLGSNVLATDSNSEPLGKALSYFPYGKTISNQQLAINNYLFTGQEQDPEIDLYNYNARLYNPKTGVFISADTVQGLNRYAYAANNPMMFTDPSGNMLDAGGGGGGGPYLPLITKDWGGGGSQSLSEQIDSFVADDTGNLTPGWEWLNYTKLINPFFYFDKYVEKPIDEKYNISASQTIGTVGTLGGLAYGGVKWLSFAKDYYYYNYAREPILKAKTFVQTLKPGNLVIRPAYTGELAFAKGSTLIGGDSAGARFYGYKLPGLSGSGEIALSEKNWEKYQSDVLCPAFVHEETHWRGFVESGGKGISGNLETALEEIRVINAEIGHYGNLESWGYARPGELSNLIESRQGVLSAWERVVESIR